MKKILILLVVFSFGLVSCVKKQIKKDGTENQTASKTETVSTQTLPTDGLSDETTEGNVRKQAFITLDTINFDFDRYELSETAKYILSKNAKTIMENKYTVTIEGHCDERGTNQYNLSLGQKRANVVKEYYIRLGVPQKNIATISYGEENPICIQSTEECWAKNRRAETKATK